MNDQSKVYVFEKKEVYLILLFIFIMSITCFTLGVKLGKSISYEKAGYTKEDAKELMIKSKEEEKADHYIEENDKLTDEAKLEQMMKESNEQITEELKGFAEEIPPVMDEASDSTLSAKESELNIEKALEEKPLKSDESAKGKFTVQLGSYDNLEEARQFAEGFTVRGYNPIINEVNLGDKGVWYRVSLGLFESFDEAKAYLQKEQTLFDGQDHIVTEIK